MKTKKKKHNEGKIPENGQIIAQGENHCERLFGIKFEFRIYTEVKVVRNSVIWDMG